MTKILGRHVDSIRTRLILLGILVVVPALVLVAVGGLVQRRQVTEQVQAVALRLARLGADEHRQQLDQTRQLLAALAQHPVVISAATDPSACSRLMGRVLQEQGGYTNLGVINLDGTVGCSAQPVESAINVADRP